MEDFKTRNSLSLSGVEREKHKGRVAAPKSGADSQQLLQYLSSVMKKGAIFLPVP